MADRRGGGIIPPFFAMDIVTVLEEILFVLKCTNVYLCLFFGAFLFYILQSSISGR